MTRPHAIVFDMDGTLTDSESMWEVVRRGLVLDAGLPYPPSATTDMMGMSTPEWAAYCSHTLRLPGTPEEIARRVIDGVAAAYQNGRIDALPGAKAAVQAMARIAPIAVASSSPPELIEAGLASLGVSDLVGVTVSSEMVSAGKPAPDVYREACRRLGVEPGDAVAVEDSSAGVRSALAAGLKLVVVPPAFHPPAADLLAQADAVLESLDSLTPDLVRSLFT